MEDASVDKSRLTFRRLSGLDRSGPPPPETQPGAPLRPWTIPNFIGYARGLLVPVFLVLALQSESGTDALPAVLFAIIGWGDYADGIAARVTRQYSRMGALLDPLIDRMLIISGVIVCWHFDLLPHWALAVLTAREVFMLGLARYAMHKKVQLKINWLGRWGVWPVFSALFFALCDVDWLALICLYVGLALVLGSTVQYVRDGLRMARDQGSS